MDINNSVGEKVPNPLPQASDIFGDVIVRTMLSMRDIEAISNLMANYFNSQSEEWQKGEMGDEYRSAFDTLEMIHNLHGLITNNVKISLLYPLNI